MRIFAASHGAERAGAELSLVEILREVDDRGHECYISVPTDGPLLKIIADLPGDVRIRRLKSRRWMGKRLIGPAGLLRLVQSLLDILPHYLLLRRIQPDVVLINTAVAPAPLIASRLAGIPCVVALRESLRTNPTLRSVLPRSLICFLLDRLSTLVVANSNYIRDGYGYPSRVVYPSVSANLGRSTTARFPRVDGRKLQIVMLGTISREKGQRDLVRACGLVPELARLAEVRLYGHGSAHEEAELRELISSSGVSSFVSFEGSTNSPGEVFASADLSVVCSKNEAFGKVTAESILANVPVVGYACGGTVEILEDGGGIAISPTVQDLARTLTDLVRNPAKIADMSLDCSKNLLVEKCMKSSNEICDALEYLGRNQQAGV